MNAKGTAISRWLLWLVLGALALICVSLVLPPMPWSHPLRDSRTAFTKMLLQELAAGTDAFKTDFGVYPPSNPATGGALPTGAANLVYYLMGPTENGWTETMPFGGAATKSYGPYYASEGSRYLAGTPPCVVDAFTETPILYFRAEAGRDPLFDVRDNPIDPTGRTGFADQAHFEMLVRPGGKAWPRGDYLIISAGDDGLFGPVVKDKTTGQLRPAQPGEKDASCDDLANFAH
jgi:hypothetical protein